MGTLVDRGKDLVRWIAVTHWPRLFRIAYTQLGDRSEAEEAVQDGLLRAMRNLSGATGAGARSAGDGEPATPRAVLLWAAAIVRNAAIDIRRRRQRLRRALGELPAARPRAAFAAADDDDSPLDVREALSRLPPHYELVVMLHVFEGRTFREIAEYTGENESTVSMRFYRARDLLRRALAEAEASDARSTA